MFVCLNVCLFVCLNVCLFVCLYVCLFECLFVRLIEYLLLIMSRTICENLYTNNPDHNQFRGLHRALVFRHNQQVATKRTEDQTEAIAVGIGAVALGALAVGVGLLFAGGRNNGH